MHKYVAMNNYRILCIFVILVLHKKSLIHPEVEQFYAYGKTHNS